MAPKEKMQSIKSKTYAHLALPLIWWKQCKLQCLYRTVRWVGSLFYFYSFILEASRVKYLPKRPNSSTPSAAKMKKSRKNRSPRFPTCGRACMTVSSNARIPLAIFNSFKTENLSIEEWLDLRAHEVREIDASRIEKFYERTGSGWPDQGGIRSTQTWSSLFHYFRQIPFLLSPRKFLPLAIRRTLMTLMIVGLIGIILDSSSSRTMPITDKITIRTSNWFHL